MSLTFFMMAKAVEMTLIGNSGVDAEPNWLKMEYESGLYCLPNSRFAIRIWRSDSSTAASIPRLVCVEQNVAASTFIFFACSTVMMNAVAHMLVPTNAIPPTVHMRQRSDICVFLWGARRPCH